MRFLREDEGCRTMRLMEGSADTSGQSKGISKRALKNWVVSRVLFFPPHCVSM